jgi:hypothetical protein
MAEDTDRYVRSLGGAAPSRDTRDLDALIAAENAYREACARCASAEKCEAEIRRIRSVETDSRETACP